MNYRKIRIIWHSDRFQNYYNKIKDSKLYSYKFKFYKYDDYYDYEFDED